MPSPPSDSRGHQAGAALVEMVVAVPLLVALLLAMADFGKYFMARNVLQSAAYNGAKMACRDATQVRATVDATVGSVLPVADVSLSGPTTLGSTPTTIRARLQVSYAGTTLSSLTTALGLYPITATGLAMCPPPP